MHFFFTVYISLSIGNCNIEFDSSLKLFVCGKLNDEKNIHIPNVMVLERVCFDGSEKKI